MSGVGHVLGNIKVSCCGNHVVLDNKILHNCQLTWLQKFFIKVISRRNCTRKVASVGNSVIWITRCLQENEVLVIQEDYQKSV